MEIAEQQIFVTSCYTTYLEDIDNSKIIERAFHHEKNTPSNQRSNQGGYQSPPFIETDLSDPEVSRLFNEFIVPAAQYVVDSWNLNLHLNKYSYWYNINRRHDYNSGHSHPFSYISGVYYAKVPSNSGNILFERAQTELDRMQFQQHYIVRTNQHIDNNRINTQYWFEPHEGLLILFPGHLTHEVKQNLTTDEDDIRVSLSFNFS